MGALARRGHGNPVDAEPPSEEPPPLALGPDALTDALAHNIPLNNAARRSACGSRGGEKASTHCETASSDAILPDGLTSSIRNGMTGFPCETA